MKLRALFWYFMHAREIGLKSRILVGKSTPNCIFFASLTFKNLTVKILGSMPFSRISLTIYFAFSVGFLSKFGIIQFKMYPS